jgi:hypothetical protein
MPITYYDRSETTAECGIFQLVGLHDKRCKMYMRNQIQDCHGRRRIKQEGDSFHQQIGLKFQEETSDYIWSTAIYGA